MNTCAWIEKAPSTERHPRRHPGIRPPADPRTHVPVSRAAVARQRDGEDVGGFDDPDKLLKIRLRAGDKACPPSMPFLA